MTRILAILALMLSLMAGPVRAAEEIVAGLSQNRISITAQFNGSQILIYGAVKRNEPEPQTAPLKIIVSLEGPSLPVTVRRKVKTGGIWINRDKVEVDSAPTYYAVATSAPIGTIISHTEDLRRRITIPTAIRSVGASGTVTDSGAFSEALIRLRTRDGLYKLSEGAVDIVKDTLFRATFDLPANLVEGNYRVRILLYRDKVLLDEATETIFVRRVGLERWLANTAEQQSEFYGVLSLLIAGFAGWVAAAIFRFIRS